VEIGEEGLAKKEESILPFHTKSNKFQWEFFTDLLLYNLYFFYLFTLDSEN
jgi:hypothetical protein